MKKDWFAIGFWALCPMCALAFAAVLWSTFILAQKFGYGAEQATRTSLVLWGILVNVAWTGLLYDRADKNSRIDRLALGIQAAGVGIFGGFVGGQTYWKLHHDPEITLNAVILSAFVCIAVYLIPGCVGRIFGKYANERFMQKLEQS